METLMIKAIREFKKQFKGCEIRSICIYEGTGSFKNWQDGLFHIEYVEVSCGNYKSFDILVSKD